MATFLGMRGNGDWVTDQRPKSWRETILYLYPNGKAPLTAILSKMGNESVDDPQFHWWTESYQNQGGDITGVYDSASLSSATTSALSAGDVVYVQMAAATVGHFRVGHQAVLRNEDDYSEDTNVKIVQVVENGASSYVAVKALQAMTVNPNSDFDRILIIGNVNAEGAAMPDAISYDPVKWYNYTQIFRTPLSITRTAQKTKLRTGNAYQKMKMQALEYHSIEMEKAFLFGYPSEGTGTNGKPERTTMGLINAIRGIAHSTYGGYPATYTDYNGVTSDFPTAHSGSTWLEKGEEWIDTQLEQIFRYGDTEKLAFCGNQALMGIQRLIKTYGQFQFNPKTAAYGLKVMEWVTAFGTINIMTHPLFNLESSLRNSAVIFEPRNLNYRYIDDTTFYEEGEKQNTGTGRIDGKSEEYLTEAGLEFHHPIGWGFLTGWNTDG
jgi:hypothetical protein